MALHPAIAPLLAQMNKSPLDICKLSAQQYRQIADNIIPPSREPALEVVEELQLELAGRTLAGRLYKSAAEKLPVIVFFHGGGWICGNLDTHDSLCRKLAQLTGAAVIAVDYRLAPEHAFPAAANDAFAACQWVLANADTLNVDASRMAVAGDSAGGNLAISACLQARGSEVAIALQCLFYPVCDASLSSHSYREFSEGYFLTAQAMAKFWLYYGEAAKVSPLASIALADDFSNLPPAFITTAQYDVLRDEALAYAEQLRLAGVTVESEIVDGMIHGFSSFYDWLEPANDMLERAAVALKQALNM